MLSLLHRTCLVRWLCFLVVGLATAQEQKPGQDPVELSVPVLQARLENLQADASLGAELKASLVEATSRAVELVKATELQLERLRRYGESRSTATARLAARQRDLADLDGRRPGPPGEGLSLAELEQGFAAAQQAQADAQRIAGDLEREATRRAERRLAVPTLLAELRARLETLPALPADPGEIDPRLHVARRLLRQAERARLTAEIEALTTELATYDAETELQRAERDLAARRMATSKAEAEAWLAALQPLRQAAAREAERQAQQSVLQADPRVANLANGNAELASALARLAEQRQRVEREQAERDAERRRLQQDFDEVRKRAELVGANDAIGGLLRQRRASLAETARSNQQRTRSRRERIVDAQLRSLDYEEQRRRLIQDPEAWLQTELGGPQVAATLPAVVVDEARRLREVRRDLLRQLAEGHEALLNTQIDVDATERQVTELIATYRSYLTERVLGIRSAAPLWRLDLRAATQAVAWFADPRHWQEVVRLLLFGLYSDFWPLLLLLPLLGLLGYRRAMRRALQRCGDQALRGTNVSYHPTALAGLYSLLLAVPPAGMVAFVGWRLLAQPDCSDFGKAMAAGALQVALVLAVVAAVFTVTAPKGLAEAHFRWQTTTITRLRSVLPWFALALLPFSFSLAALEQVGDDRWLGSLGGLLLVAELVLLTIAFWRLLHPQHGIIGGSLKANTGPLFRFRRLWFLLGIGVPLTLLGMTVLGYEYTALQLARRLQLTVALILAGALVHALILRGLLLARRRLQIQLARERLQAAKAGDSAAAAESGDGDGMDPQLLARQTQTLLRGAVVIGVALLAVQIWIDVMPAFGMLRRYQIWDGGTEASPMPVTLADLGLGLFILVAGMAAARNLPALLELLVLQHLRMQPGERHAVTTLARYGIFIIGLVLAFGSIGIGWSKVQWLVAAVSVGLGFGLQEVFANFVSGIILLFEQPIRVGDMVTVGDTTGRVTKIRIRATTIQDWDRKELVVPNRSFVTSSFVNWTLGDAQVRWIIKVGLAYGSDTRVALDLLEESALESQYVLRDPRPEAVFTGFGDSTLDLQLRLFVDMNSLQYRWMTEIYQTIDRKFRAAGLVIAFPQRDVHLHLDGPTLGVLRRGNPPPSGADPG